MKYTLDIDGVFSKYEFSGKFVKNILAKHENKPVVARFRSLGGSVDEALDISAQFEQHGNVTVEMIGFNASASTVAALGASKIRIHQDGMYLIHKAMSWVDEWGLMNEDDIQLLIEKLTKEQKENEKVTLVLARKYVNKSGKSLTDVLNLMKENTWLTADEAKEWGFVDEVFGKAGSMKENYSDIQEKFNALELPFPERLKNNNQEPSQDRTWIEQQFSALSDKITNLIAGNKNSNNPPKTITTNMRKEFTHINTILGKEGVEEKEGTVSLSVDNIQQINQKIEEKEKALKDKTTEYDNLKQEFENFKQAAGDKTGEVNKDTDNNGSASFSNEYGKTMALAKSMFEILPEE